jgi:hypothetical protein
LLEYQDAELFEKAHRCVPPRKEGARIPDEVHMSERGRDTEQPDGMGLEARALGRNADLVARLDDVQEVLAPHPSRWGAGSAPRQATGFRERLRTMPNVDFERPRDHGRRRTEEP